MTFNSPRIYTYKITFEEVPYYYYGVKKEKYFNEEYWGSPKTNKWCWELYTPKKQILELFDFTDEGYDEAQEIEKRLIIPVLNDKWCLNENVGGVFSIKCCSEAGKKSGEKTKELRLGIHSLTQEQILQNATKGGKISKENKTGIFGLTPEQRKENSSNAGKKAKEMKVGIFILTKKQLSENGVKGGKIGGKNGSKNTNSQRWECCETGYISTPAGLSTYQKKRDIDTSKRRRIS
jgi:hypothetical protein